jgi:branched-chain amino acid transport system ATP-binding protein
MLELRDVSTGYGRVRALQGLSAEVATGQTLAVLGPNGAGKSTLLKLVIGLQPLWSGSIQMNGKDVGALDVENRVRGGIVLCPEGRRIFASLSVEENLRIGGTVHLSLPGGAQRLQQQIERSYEMFPILRERRLGPGSALSGGQQQMLAIARALMAQPRLLLLDEPSLGLSPVMADEVYAALAKLKHEGLSMIVVEEAAGRPLALADQVIILRQGHKVWTGTATAAHDPDLLHRTYLGEEVA